MSRYHSDSDDAYVNRRRRSDSVKGSGWTSPLPQPTTSTINTTASSSSSAVTRLVVEPPFGSRKCDYTIDKSQRGRLIITARRRQTLPSDQQSSNQKNHVAVQTFTIPTDADVERLQSRLERDTNRLIIEIPRQQRKGSQTPRPSYIDTTNMVNSRLLRSPDVERMLTSPTGGPQLVRDDSKSSSKNSSSNRKLEYRIDCRGYAADELDVSIQGRDLIVRGQTNTSSSPDPTQQRVSKKFTRKIALPNTVDLARVVSYLEHGELRIEAPLKRGVYYTDEEIIIPGPPPTSSTTSNRGAVASMLTNPVRSPTPLHRSRYRRNDQQGRRRDYDRSNTRGVSSPMRRARSVENLSYPHYISPRELDDDDLDEANTIERDSQRRRTANQERLSVERKDSSQRPIYKSVYSPTANVVTTARTSRISRQDYPSDDDNYLRF